jgi:hypothetical protein
LLRRESRSKRFFFEKKKQKTLWVRVSGAEISTDQKSESFCAFFSKKRLCLLIGFLLMAPAEGEPAALSAFLLKS